MVVDDRLGWTLSRGGRAEATEGEVVDDVLATLQVVLERVELAAERVITEVELGVLAVLKLDGKW
jgi:hypothetical protein